jgi:lipoprotein-anchoring transpeptidase ErfK/SrfK
MSKEIWSIPQYDPLKNGNGIVRVGNFYGSGLFLRREEDKEEIMSGAQIPINTTFKQGEIAVLTINTGILSKLPNNTTTFAAGTRPVVIVMDTVLNATVVTTTDVWLRVYGIDSNKVILSTGTVLNLALYSQLACNGIYLTQAI